MIISAMDLAIYGVGAVLLAIWMIFYLAGLKHASLFEVLDESEYPFKDIYGLGFAVMEAIHYTYRSKGDRKLRKEITVLYGEKYADYYLRVVHAQQVTLSFTVLMLAVPMYGLANDLAATIVVVAFAALAYYYFGTVTANKILKRSEEMLHDFSDVVSKLALMTNAGMIMQEAWAEVAYTGETALYKEMQRSVVEMRNGISLIDALFRFGNRCILPEIKKITSTLVQGIVNGNEELALMLQTQSKEVWTAKKQKVRRQGEAAASKLLIPIMLMLVGILIMIIIPVFTNLGV